MLLAALLLLSPLPAHTQEDLLSPVRKDSVLIRAVASCETTSLFAFATSTWVWILDAKTAAVQRKIRLPEGTVMSIQFDPSGQTLAAWLIEGARTHDFDEKAPSFWQFFGTGAVDGDRDCRVTTKPIEYASVARFDPSGSLFMVLNANGQIELVDAATGKMRSTLDDPEGQRTVSACWWGRERIISANAWGVVRVWDAKSATVTSTPLRLGARAACIEVSPDEQRLFVGTFTTPTRPTPMWSLPSFSPLPAPRPSDIHTPPRLGESGPATWSPDSSRILFVSPGSATVECFGRDGSQLWSKYIECASYIPIGVRWSPDGKIVVCNACRPEDTGLFDMATGAAISVCELSRADWPINWWTSDRSTTVTLNRDSDVLAAVDTEKGKVRFVCYQRPLGDLVVERPK